MFDGAALPIVALAVGLAGLAAGWLLIRSSGADPRTGRRLAGARAIPLRELQAMAAEGRLPTVPIRVSGRVRCASPIQTAGGDRLAAVHRDVEARLPNGRWRVIERVRDVRPIDLWERASAVSLDLAQVAEPLITIPQRWEGSAADLDPSYQASLRRIGDGAGAPIAARAVTRQVTLVDQLIVLALAETDGAGRLRLVPPPGGYVIANVELDIAMRLLGGPRRGRLLAGYAVGTAGAVLVGIGLVGWLVVLIG